MTLMMLSGPAAEPVSLADARQWMKVDSNDEDELIGALITSARLIVEATTRRMLMMQTWRLALDAWPGGLVYRLPLAPVLSVDTIRLRNADASATPLPALLWWLQTSTDEARLVFNAAPPVPGRSVGGIEIDLTLGYGGQPGDVPEPLRQAICLLVARWFEDRGDVISDLAHEQLPPRVAALLAPYRRVRLA